MVFYCKMLLVLHVANRQNYCNTNLVLLRLGLPKLHKTFITDRRRPYTDTPFVIPQGLLKSSQLIGDDLNLCMALNLTYNFASYSCIHSSALESVWHSFEKVTFKTHSSASERVLNFLSSRTKGSPFIFMDIAIAINPFERGWCFCKEVQGIARLRYQSLKEKRWWFFKANKCNVVSIKTLMVFVSCNLPQSWNSFRSGEHSMKMGPCESGRPNGVVEYSRIAPFEPFVWTIDGLGSR